MRIIFALLLVAFLVGCSAEAALDRESLILNNLQDKVWDDNPELLLAQCYDLSLQGKKVCYRFYEEKMRNFGQTVSQESCAKLKICEYVTNED